MFSFSFADMCKYFFLRCISNCSYFLCIFSSLIQYTPVTINVFAKSRLSPTAMCVLYASHLPQLGPNEYTERLVLGTMLLGQCLGFTSVSSVLIIINLYMLKLIFRGCLLLAPSLAGGSHGAAGAGTGKESEHPVSSLRYQSPCYVTSCLEHHYLLHFPESSLTSSPA